MHTLKCQRMVVFVFLSALFVSGCVSYRTEGLFTQPVLKTYRLHTMFGLPPDREQILWAAFKGAFPGADKRLIDGQGLLTTYDAQRARLSQEKRLRIARDLAVEAIILATHEHTTEGERHVDTLVVRIVDAANGEITGSVVVTAESDSQVSASALSAKAVAALRAHLQGRSTARRGAARTGSRPGDRSGRSGGM